MLHFTDAQTQQSIAVNPKFVVVVFTTSDGEDSAKVVINTTTGNVVVTESYLDVVGRLNAVQ
jgi:protein involved in ribonucleotide reduction